MKSSLIVAALLTAALSTCGNAFAAEQSAFQPLPSLAARNLDGAYFPVSRLQGLPGIYSDYGVLLADAESCALAMPAPVKSFYDKDLRTFAADQQRAIVSQVQGARAQQKSRFADALKTSTTRDLCDHEKGVFQFLIADFPLNETDNVFKMLGEWEAISAVCQVGDAGLPPIFEKANRLGVSIAEVENNKERYEFWKNRALLRLGAAQSQNARNTNPAYTAGPICAGAALTYEALGAEYAKSVAPDPK